MFRAAGILLLAGVFAQKAATFDLSKDFSFRRGPKQVWQYGYSATNSLDPSQFRADEYADPSSPVGFWHPKECQEPGACWYPYVAYNRSTKTQFGSSNGWSARPGEVAMEGSNSGQYSIVRFVAPVAGTYKINAKFEGIHFGLSTTDVHVLHNAESLFSADIDGYGGDPVFHAIQGSNPAASYSGEVKMNANDTVTFAVGYGKNKTNYCDTTGLFARVELIAKANNP